MRPKVGCASQGYLQDEAEVSGRFVLVPVVLGGVDIKVLEADEADEVSGALKDRQVENETANQDALVRTSKTFPELV